VPSTKSIEFHTAFVLIADTATPFVVSGLATVYTEVTVAASADEVLFTLCRCEGFAVLWFAAGVPVAGHVTLDKIDQSSCLVSIRASCS